MKFHIKWKKEKSFLIYRIQVPTAEVQHIKKSVSRKMCSWKMPTETMCISIK